MGMEEDLAGVVGKMRDFEHMDGSAKDLDRAVGDASYNAYMFVFNHGAEILSNAEDAAKYRMICKAFDGMKTSTAERFVDCLGWYDVNVCLPFDELAQQAVLATEHAALCAETDSEVKS